MDDDKASQMNEQIDYLKSIIEEKEKTISDLTKNQSLKHEEYQEKLNRFKEMQD